MELKYSPMKNFSKKVALLIQVLINDEHPLKALSTISVTEEQLAKLSGPIETTEDEILIIVNDEQHF